MIHIVTHILPQEIDQLEQLIILFKRNSLYLAQEDYKVEVVLNNHLTDWGQSKLDQSFFIDKFFNLEKILKDSLVTDFQISDGTIMGCNDIRRRALRTSDCEYIMYFDADNIFSDTLLFSMKYACDYLGDSEEQYNIIVPQVTRMWDSTWDVLVNDDYLYEEASHAVYDNRDPYLIQNDKERLAREIDTFKFAGWGTCIQSSISKIVDIPDSLGSYGVDDTFIATACQLLKNKGVNVKQYILENEIIIENNKYRCNPYKNYLKSIDRRDEFLKQAHHNFNIEIQKYI